VLEVLDNFKCVFMVRFICAVTFLLIVSKPIVKIMEKTYQEIKKRRKLDKDVCLLLVYSIAGYIFYCMVASFYIPL